MKTELTQFVKDAAEYSKETSDIVRQAYGIVNDMNARQQKCASLVPSMVTRLESLEKVNGQPFVPDGFSKHAAEFLSDHEKTITLLNNVLNEYVALKTAHDKLTPTIGTLGVAEKTATVQNGSRSDGAEGSAAMRKFTERLLNV